MRINSVNIVQNDSIKFSRNNNDLISNQSDKRSMNAEDKILLGAKCMAVIGMAAVTRIILKENNIDLAKIASDKIKNLGKKLMQKPSKDEVINLLDGRRDAEGLKIYNAYIAKKKQESLAKKVLNGDFKHKSSDVFKHITNNSAKLQRAAGAI